MVQPVNIRTMRTAASNAARHIQNEKIQVSRATIARLQAGDRWPDEYDSFHTSETRRNRFPDPGRFFRVMAATPKLWNRRFIFRARTQSGEFIREATIFAFDLIVNKARDYGTQTGLYAASFIIDLDGRPLQRTAQLNDVNDQSVVRIYNTAPYAGTVEKNALYFTRIGGVIYFAAKRLKRKYPQLGIGFDYRRASKFSRVTHNYAVPVLSIGPADKIIGRLKVPGKNYRRRRREQRRRS